MKTNTIREKTRSFFEFISIPFIWLRIPPSVISIFALFMLLGVFYSVEQRMFYLAALFIALNGLFDVIDGCVARKTKKASLFGKFLDRTVDKISDAAILAAFLVYGIVSLRLGLYTIIVMLLSTNVSANIEGVLKLKISDAVSLRFVRILLLVVFTVLQLFTILFWILAVLSTYSFIYRVITAYIMWKKK